MLESSSISIIWINTPPELHHLKEFFISFFHPWFNIQIQIVFVIFINWCPLHWGSGSIWISSFDKIRPVGSHLKGGDGVVRTGIYK